MAIKTFTYPGVNISTTGLATEAKQDVGNSSLSSIDTKTPALVSGRQPVDGSGVTQPISAASLPLPAGAATSALQTTGNSSLSSVDTKLTTTINGLKVDGSAVTQPVSGTLAVSNFPATQAVSAASLPLPTGAATSANQNTVITSLASIDTKTAALGQAVMASSSPVVIASNQTAIPISLPDGTLQTVTGSFTAPGQYVQLTTNGASIVSFRTTGTWAGLIGVYASVDGTTFDLIPLYDFTGQTSQTYSGGNTPFSANVGGFKVVRVQAVTLTSGTAAVATWFNPGQGPQICLSPAAAGFYTTTNLRAGDATAITQTAGALDVNLKTSTITLPVKAMGKTVVTKSRNDYAVTAVTTSVYLQLVASTSAAISELEIFDSSGQTLVIAIGAAASEVEQIYILPGGNGRVPLTIAAASRIAVKAVSATASVGELTINFYS